MPKLKELFNTFLNNEYYSVISKFDAMRSIEIIDIETFVRDLLERNNFV